MFHEPGRAILSVFAITVVSESLAPLFPANKYFLFTNATVIIPKLDPAEL